MEMAQAFKIAKDNGHGPKRSILFIHLTAEEIGLQGSKYYTEYPAFDLDKTVANLNIDMIGRIDNNHKDNKNYIYLIGSDRLSKELHYISEKVNNAYTQLELDYTYNDENDNNKYYYRSDHYNFAQNNIPVIFYFNGEHEDYHEATDTPDKIDYELLEKRTKLIFATAWQIANQEHRLEVDIQDSVVLVLGGIQHGCACLDAGIVDHHIELTEFADGGSDQFLEIPDLAHIGVHADAFVAKARDFPLQLLRRFGVSHIVDDDIGAVPGQLKHDGLTDARIAAGHYCDFVLQRHRAPPFSRRCHTPNTLSRYPLSFIMVDERAA